MRMPIIVLYGGAYRVEDDRTGQILEGFSCSYYLRSDLKSVNNANGTIGLRPAKFTFPIDSPCIAKIWKAPALYDAEFAMSVDSKGKPSLSISDLDYVSAVELKPLTDSEDKPETAATPEDKAVKQKTSA